jgi:hypothetical protein
MTTYKRLALKVKRSSVVGCWTVNGEQFTGNKGECVAQWLHQNARWNGKQWEVKGEDKV